MMSCVSALQRDLQATLISIDQQKVMYSHRPGCRQEGHLDEQQCSRYIQFVLEACNRG